MNHFQSQHWSQAYPDRMDATLQSVAKLLYITRLELEGGIRGMEHRQESLHVIVDHFLDTLESHATIRAYRRSVETFLRFLKLQNGTLDTLFGLSFDDLSSGAISFLKRMHRTDEHSGEILNPRTVNLNRYALSSFFQFLQSRHEFPWNPVSNLKKLKVPKKSNTLPLTESQALAILQNLKREASKNEVKARDFLIISGLFLLALRRKELAHLRWDQIDFDRGLARFKQKGGTERVVPVPEGYLQLLQSFREMYGEPCPYVFRPVKNNRSKIVAKPISPDYIYYLVKTVASTVAPDTKITPHSFRTSFVTIASSWGEDPKAILNGTGHGSYDMLLYYHMGEELEVNSIHAMGRYLREHGII